VNTKRRKIFCLAVLFIIALIICVTPFLYKNYTVSRFTNNCDREFGTNGWVLVGLGADLQENEKIHLYRTIYVRLIYPKFQYLTPWRNIRFIDNHDISIRPWHFFIHIATKDREITYYWSISKNSWIDVWDNHIDQEPVEDQKIYSKLVERIARLDGLNQSLNSFNPGDFR
jgi:hypothetical protein